MRTRSEPALPVARPFWARLRAWLGWEASPPGVRGGPPPASASRPPSAPFAPLDAPWAGLVPAPGVDAGAARAHVVRTLLALQPAEPALAAAVLAVAGDESLDLPVFPDVARALDRLLRAGDPPVTEVARLIQQDPDLVRRVWQAANGAAWARAAASLDHALARIGMDETWRIAMGACVHAPVFRLRAFQAQADRARARGLVAAEVAAHLAAEGRGDAWVAGLVHEAGPLVVWRAAARARPAPPAGVVEALLREIGPSMSVLVAHAWGLGRAVAWGAGLHPDPSAASPEGRRMARTVQVARICAVAVLEAEEGRDWGALGALSEDADPGVDPASALRVARETLGRLRAGAARVG